MHVKQAPGIRCFFSYSMCFAGTVAGIPPRITKVAFIVARIVLRFSTCPARVLPFRFCRQPETALCKITLPRALVITPLITGRVTQCIAEHHRIKPRYLLHGEVRTTERRRIRSDHRLVLLLRHFVNAHLERGEENIVYGFLMCELVIILDVSHTEGTGGDGDERHAGDDGSSLHDEIIHPTINNSKTTLFIIQDVIASY